MSMSESRSPVTEAELHAYVDNRLPPDRAAAVVAYLADHPAEAERVEAWRRQTEALRALYDPVLSEPVPARLLQSPRPSRLMPGLTRVAAAVLLVLAGGIGGWVWRGYEDAKLRPTVTLAKEATTAHLVYAPEVRHPVEVTAREQAHLVAWLSKRLGKPVRAPNLAEAGYALMGGRLLPASEGLACQFMYENAQGQRVTLYIRSGNVGGPTAFRFVSEGKAQGFYWIDGPLGYALIGEIERDSLLALARLVYQQLSP